MRLLLALGCAVLALVAWLTCAPRHEPERGIETDEARATASAVEEPRALAEVPTAVSRAPAAESISSGLAEPPPSASSSITGRAIDDGGTPVPGAAVTLTVLGDEDDVPRTTVHSRTDGRFAFELSTVLSAEARVTLSVSATEFHVKLARTIPDSDEADPHEWTAGANDLGDFVLQRCGAVRGRVVDAEGHAIDLAFIELYPAATGRRTGTTAAQGEFRVSELPPDSYKIGVRSARWMTHTTEPIVIPCGETTVVPDIVLAPAPTIRGLVVDETGAGVSGLRIEGRAPVAAETASTTTRSDGAFVLLLCADEPTTVRVRGTEREFESSGGERILAPGAADVRIVLKRLPRMRFLVLDEKRVPIERYDITLFTAEPHFANSYDNYSDRTFDPHPRGEWSSPLRGADTVVVLAPQCAPAKLRIVADAGKSGVQTIQLEPASRVTGRVRLDGRPFSAGYVRLVSYSGSREDPAGLALEETLRTERNRPLDENGAFEFDDLRAGPYVLHVTGQGVSPFVLEPIIVARGQTYSVGDVGLTRAASVRGTILTRSGDSPQGFRVKLDWREAGEIVGADGRFAFTGLAVGPHRLVWSRPGESESLVDRERRTVEFELASGEERELVIDARDSASCSLTVRVTRNGRPAAGLAIHGGYSANARANSSAKLCDTDADGVATTVLDAARGLTLFVLDAESHVLGGSGRMIDLVSGGHVDEHIRLETGTIVVELPAALVPVTDGRVTLWFPNSEQTSVAACARGSAWQCKREWTSNTIDLGEFAAGSYDVTVAVERWFPPEIVMREQRTSFSEPLRQPHTCRIEVRSGAVTRIVVP